jgi:prevent-host-death family protein
MSRPWQIQTAKNKLSELLKRAQKEPQVITKHGENVAVVISYAEYERLTRPKETLLELFRRFPGRDLDLDFSRSKDTSAHRDRDLPR